MSKKIVEMTEDSKTRGGAEGRRPHAKEVRLEVKAPRLSRRLKKELRVKLLDEDATRRLEKKIPLLAKNATTLAFRRALTSGSKVLIAEAGELIELLPDGTRRAVKKLDPSVKMRKGQIIKLRFKLR